MSDVSRSCARCRDVAVVTRGNAAYCMKCNEILDWAEVIAVVQTAVEPTVVFPAERVADSVVASPEELRPDGVAPAITVPTTNGVQPDPFSRRLA